MLERCLLDMGLSIDQLKAYQELHSNEMVKTMVATSPALGALPASMVAQDIAAERLWPITLKGHSLRAEAIWMVRSPHRQDSQLMSRFEALLPKAPLNAAGQ